MPDARGTAAGEKGGVLLVNIPYSHAGAASPPLGLACVAAALDRSGTRVGLLDLPSAPASAWWSERLKKLTSPLTITLNSPGFLAGRTLIRSACSVPVIWSKPFSRVAESN